MDSIAHDTYYLYYSVSSFGTFDGTDYLVAHAYDLSDEGRSKLMILKMEWDEDGWPVVSLDN